MIDDAFLGDLPDDPIAAAHAMTTHVMASHKAMPTLTERRAHYDEYLSALGIYQALCEAYGLPYQTLELGKDVDRNIALVVGFFEAATLDLTEQLSHLKVERARYETLGKFGKRFGYQFSEGDLSRIQVLINDLRELIAGSALIADGHKRRLLLRLERLQAELHKKVSDLDHFWGLLGEAGVVLGKFGNDVKPLLDRIQEIIAIAWRTQARAEELPSGTPPPLLLPGPQDRV